MEIIIYEYQPICKSPFNLDRYPEAENVFAMYEIEITNKQKN